MAAGTERLFMWAIECIFSSMKTTMRIRPVRVANEAAVFIVLFATVPAGGTSAAIGDNEKFGTFSFYGQLSDKVSNLPVRAGYSAGDVPASRMGLRFAAPA